MHGSSAHISRITSIVQNPLLFKEYERPEWKLWRPGISSWQRCFDEHGLDPSRKCDPQTLSSPELRQHKEMMGRELNMARDELDNLFLAVRGSGYSVSLADHTGLVVLERSDYNSETYFPPDRPGTRWSEPECGTNGIGTALLERRPVAVYHDDHFFSDLIHVACIGMPVFDVDGQILGAINLSIRNERLSEQTHRLIYDVARVSVQRLEEKFFYARHNGALVVRLNTAEGPAALLALGADEEILGFNRMAGQALALQPGAATSLWDHFERTPKILAQGDEAPVILKRLGSDHTLQARVTAPNIVEKGYAPPALLKPAPRTAKPVAASPATPGLDACAGQDMRMQAHVKLLRRLRGANLPVLLLGETGVGKDTLARAIHTESDRASGPFVVFNCAAIPESLIDSELFGYGAGAFTGAKKDGHIGRVKAADGGTLFLDEIGDMPVTLQTRLLRVLETGEVTPLGSGRVQYADIRIIAATNQELEVRIADGRFRQDLYHRLAGLVLTLPPLRERGDLEQLVRQLLENTAGARRFIVSAAAMQAMRAYSWPGNVRELRHVLQRAAKLAESHVIELEDLMLPQKSPPMAMAPMRMNTGVPAAHPAGAKGRGAKEIVARAEREVLEETMGALKGDIDLVARQLGISRATLYRKLRLHGIKTSQRGR